MHTLLQLERRAVISIQLLGIGYWSRYRRHRAERHREWKEWGGDRPTGVSSSPAANYSYPVESDAEPRPKMIFTEFDRQKIDLVRLFQSMNFY